MDLEHADDTALIAHSREMAEKVRKEDVLEAASHGLTRSRHKTSRLSYKSDGEVWHGDGSEVKRASLVKCLGSVMEESGSCSAEVRARIHEASSVMRS
eukprot:702878-Alexandrium_andersonii.AAC.1